ncbi:MAG: response regulator transcription factor [Gammaproteobacteria bacterium]|nr:response regulator transcription factor [Gammaproteobacteria bacterium]
MPGSVSEQDAQGHVLLIEDDVRLAELIARFLGEHGYLVDQAYNGSDALRCVRLHAYDLVICDLMLPDTHGFHLMERIRLDINTPFLFLTAVDTKELQIKGFELGAVDFVIKPVDPDILLARIKSHMRQAGRVASGDSHQLCFRDFTLDKTTRECHTSGQVLRISEHEFALLWLLAKHPGTVLSRDFLFNYGANREYDGLDRTIDGRISRLRKKLDAVPGCPYEVRTVWGKGYVFCERGHSAP